MTAALILGLLVLIWLSPVFLTMYIKPDYKPGPLPSERRKREASKLAKKQEADTLETIEQEINQLRQRVEKLEGELTKSKTANHYLRNTLNEKIQEIALLKDGTSSQEF